MNLLNTLSSFCLYLPNIALNSGTYDEFSTSEIKDCCIACANDQCCIAYTFDKLQSRCFLKSSILDSYKTSTSISGIKANSYLGQGSILKNVKIYGGTASAVILPTSEQCKQYCTVYNIYSWSLIQTEQKIEQNSLKNPKSVKQGKCSCMSKISSLQYSYGSRSEIFPPSSNKK